MVFRHTFFSKLKDLSNFSKIKKIRSKKFNDAPSSPVQSSFNSNNLAKRLHPNKTELKIIKKTVLQNGAAIIKLTAVNGRVPFFRAGQYITVKACINGKTVSEPFFIASSPQKALEGSYDIYVPKKEDGSLNFYLINAADNDSRLTADSPAGFLYYESLRDKPSIAFFADNSGIGAALSLQNAAEDKTENISLNVFCDNNELCGLSPSHFSPLPNNKEICELCKNKSVYICGTREFCGKIKSMLPHGITPRVCATNAPVRVADSVREYTCKVTVNGNESIIKCRSNETVLSAFEQNGIPSQAKCRNGECGYCRIRLISGKVTSDFAENADSRRTADIKYGFIHPCCTFADSDLILEL